MKPPRPQRLTCLRALMVIMLAASTIVIPAAAALADDKGKPATQSNENKKATTALASDETKAEEAKTTGPGFLGIVMLPTFIREDDGNAIPIVQVIGIVGGSGAEKAGLVEGDKIIAIDGKKFESTDTAATTLGDYIQAKAPGDKVKLTLRRGDKNEIIEVELGERPAELSLPEPQEGSSKLDPNFLEAMREAQQEADRRDTPPPIPLLEMRPGWIEIAPGEAEGHRTDRIRIERSGRITSGEPFTEPEPERLEALGKAVRDSEDGDEQFVNLIAYCAHLTSGVRDRNRFAGIELRFYNSYLVELKPFESAEDLAKTFMATLIYTAPSGHTHLLHFRLPDDEQVKRLGNLSSKLDNLFGHLRPAPAKPKPSARRIENNTERRGLFRRLEERPHNHNSPPAPERR